MFLRIVFSQFFIAKCFRKSLLFNNNINKLCCPIWDCGGWVPETSWSYHYWQPATRWRPHWWLVKPDNPAMSPHALDKTGIRHTDTQWKAEGGEGREQKLLNAPHIMLLLPTHLINKPYSPEHEGFHACASMLIPLTNWLQTLLVVEPHMTTLTITIKRRGKRKMNEEKFHIYCINNYVDIIARRGPRTTQSWDSNRK